MGKLSKNTFLTSLLALLIIFDAKADVTITPTGGVQNGCNNYVTVQFNVNGFSNLISLDYGITWDENVLEYVSHNIPVSPGMQDPTINDTETSMGNFGVFWFDNTNTGQNLPDGSNIIEILFRVNSDVMNTMIKVESIMGMVNNEAFDAGFVMVPVIGAPLTSNFNSPVLAPSLSLNYEVLKTPNGCNDTLQFAVKVDECFLDLTSVQFSIDWDTSKYLYLSSTMPYNPGGDVAIANTTETITEGRIGYGWASLSNSYSSAPNNSSLLLLTLKNKSIGASIIQDVDLPLIREVYDQNFEEINLEFNPATLNVSTNNYSTFSDGDYYNPSTWVGGCVPSNPVLSGTNIYINHNVNLPVNQNITNFGTISSTLPFINNGVYQGNGLFNGNFINNGFVRPSNN